MSDDETLFYHCFARPVGGDFSDIVVMYLLLYEGPWTKSVGYRALAKGPALAAHVLVPIHPDLPVQYVTAASNAELPLHRCVPTGYWCRGMPGRGPYNTYEYSLGYATMAVETKTVGGTYGRCVEYRKGVRLISRKGHVYSQ
ncbi:MAG: hypothetical protein EHM35_18620 [Planctomycetaceae bacterium]|nr:MAG: hypothetical protein EHM35_18620 [Planctomycetaceae bacterium]